MSKFKIGDKVRCVDRGGNFYISDGREYTVTAVFDNQIVIENNMGENKPYYVFRFELVESDLPKYVLVEARKVEFLEQVNELIAKGYTPQGGVAVDQQFYIQALVLNEPC